MIEKLKDFLDSKVEQYNQPSFIKDDPVSIPHLFTKKQDIKTQAPDSTDCRVLNVLSTTW